MNNNNYEAIKAYVIEQSQELNTPLIELLNDVTFVTGLCGRYGISFDIMLLIVKRMELEAC